MTALAGLFAVAFLSATILPGSSEAALAAVLSFGQVTPTAAILTATIGNTIGSIVNWAIGRFGARFAGHPRFPVSPDRFERYVEAYRRYGVWSLLLSWVPIIGDPLTVMAGVARTPLVVFIPLVAIGKGVRYLAVAGVFALA